MIKLFFLVPVLLCIAWFYFLNANKIPLKQGKMGFVYILGSAALFCCFSPYAAAY